MALTIDTSICNMALSHLGISKEIATVTERSAEANACRRYYEPSLEEMLRDFVWPFATQFPTLALVATAPTTEWDFSYRYPTECLKFRRILSGTRNDTRATRVPYRIISDSSGRLILTDEATAVAEIGIKVEDPTLYPPDMKMAFSLLIAHYAAPRLTNGDPNKLGKRAMELYLYEVSKAECSSANEEQAEEEPDSSLIDARN